MSQASLLEQESVYEQQLKTDYQYTETEEKVVKETFNRFRECADERNKNYQYFDGSNLIDYINDSVLRFITNIDEREDIEEWQARVHTPFTRNKVLAILGKVVQVLPIAELKARGDEDTLRASILSDIYQYAEDVDNYEEFMIHYLLEAIVKGTAIGYEGLERKERKLRNVTKYNDEISVTEDKEITSKLFASIVPLENFYPSSVSIRTIDKMPYCFWRETIPYSKFCMDWGMFSKSQYVLPYSSPTDSGGDKRPFYADYVSDDVQEGMVEVIRYYNRESDEYIVIANGIWLNPIFDEKNGREIISPLPFNHKELPFFDIKFDLFGDFFYGKSLPDRLKSMQDVLNVLTNMLLDQSFLTIFPPLLTNGFDSIEDDYLRPGRRTPIDTQGLSINDAFMKLDLGTPSGWHQYILEYTKRIMEESSLDQVSSGAAGVGGRTTAQEIRVAADGVTALLGIFARLVNYGIKRKAKFKTSNAMQFWTDKKTPYIYKIIGGRKVFNKAFNIFKIEGTTLSDGTRGTRIIEMYGSKKAMPTKEQLKARETISKAATGKNIEIVAVPPTYIRDFDFDVKLVPNQKKENTKDVEKALQLEKVRIYMSFFPQLVNMQELAAQTAEKLGDDPTKILNDEVFQAPPGEDNPEADKGMSQEPEQNTANNMVRGMRGGEESSMQLRDLQNMMSG